MEFDERAFDRRVDERAFDRRVAERAVTENFLNANIPPAVVQRYQEQAEHANQRDPRHGPDRRKAITLETVERCFTYQAPRPDQLDAFAQVRDAALLLARTILRTVPDCPDRAKALDELRLLRMRANAAISLDGEF